MARKRKYTKEILEPVVSRCVTIADVCRELGLGVNAGGNHTHISKRIAEYGIDTSHIVGSSHLKGKMALNRGMGKRLDEILVVGSDYSRCHLKKRLLRDGIFENRCALCGLKGEWKGKPLNMVLDHINGVNNDNRIENIRMLCPNCNSQQDTFCGKNNKKELIIRCECCGKQITRRNKSKKCASCRSWGYNPPRKFDPEVVEFAKENGLRAACERYSISHHTLKKWMGGNVSK